MKRKPTKMHILEGTYQKHRHNPNEPDPDPAIPDPPDHLSKEALVEWKRITPQLYDLGLLSQIDRSALALYCQAYGGWVTAERELADSPLLVESITGNIVPNPLIAISKMFWEKTERAIKNFGMSPAHRPGVNAAKKESVKDKWAENF